MRVKNLRDNDGSNVRVKNLSASKEDSENHLEASTRMYAVFDCKGCFYCSKLTSSKQVSNLVFYAQSTIMVILRAT